MCIGVFNHSIYQDITEKIVGEKMKISKEKTTHYILLYIMLQYIGGRLLPYLGSTFHLIALAISLFAILFHQSRYKNAELINWLILLVASLGVTVMMTFGGLSIGTSVAILSRFLVAWAAIAWNYDYFVERLVKISVFLCSVSCILFAIVSVLGMSSVSWLLPYLEVIQGTDGKPITYGLFLVVFNVMDLTRNAGIFGEPGELQILVNMALYFLLFRTPVDLNKKKMTYFILLIITMATNRSTTGLMSTIVLLVCYLLNAKDEDKKTKHLISLLIAVASVYLVFFAGEDSIITSALINKMMLNGRIDFQHGTASARMMSFAILEKVIRTKPLSLILGVGFNGLVSFITEETALACAGLISGWIMFGSITYLIIYGKTIGYLTRMKRSAAELICLIFMIINNGLGQPDIMSIFVVIIGAYFCESKWRNYNYTIEG